MRSSFRQACPSSLCLLGVWLISLSVSPTQVSVTEPLAARLCSNTGAGRDPPRAGGTFQLPEGVTPVRRLVLLAVVAVMAVTAVAAYAVDNTVSYTEKVTFKGTPSAQKPLNMAYPGIFYFEHQPPGP